MHANTPIYIKHCIEHFRNYLWYWWVHVIFVNLVGLLNNKFKC